MQVFVLKTTAPNFVFDVMEGFEKKFSKMCVRVCVRVCVHVCGSGGNEKINLKRVQGEGAHTKSEVASANRAMPPTPHPGIKPRSHAFFVGDVRKV